MADKQTIEISIKRTSYVAFWYNEVTFLNSAANSKRKIGFCDERKLKEEDVVNILMKQGLDVSNMTSDDWYDNNKWDFSAYEIPQREAIKAMTIKADGSVCPKATWEVRKKDGESIGYIHVLCGLDVKNFQGPLPYGMSQSDWIEGVKAWENNLPSFKSIEGYNAWMRKYCDGVSFIFRIQDYFEGLVQGACSLSDSDTEQLILGLDPSLNYHLANYNRDKEKNYSEYPNYYDRCDYYISELAKDSSRVMEFFGEYEDRDHPAFDRTPSCDEIWEILRTYEAYEKAKKEAPKYFTDEYIAEHFKL